MRPVIISLLVKTVYLCCFPVSLAADSHSDESEVLFQCSLNNAANTVSVILFSDNVQYFYSNAEGRVELSIKSPLSDVDYTPFAWDSPDVAERITFHNGETSYEVFHIMNRSGINFTDGSNGGVVVIAPSGQRTEILCDENSIMPVNVFHGIGRMASLRSEDYDAFQQCLSSELSATACLNVEASSCSLDIYDQTECLTVEYDRWRAVLAEKLSAATELDHAQHLWEASRDADCGLSAWVVYNPFEEDVGMLSCLSDYTARRVDFVNNYIVGIEFDG
ncbi:Uncharacterized conserved protein YecT, DUF1311 family [Monaibacterium marinum]|uniref:Uncharacterized conserved protein YecT, DUF1311 family n=1 Tax=Pontivivens marinum TaxID=1690039 RepID=A0A2C9CYH5_9RHOB|nr:lysozyme inhibitor LprI family protein [Monaibacterium marinum]SOH95509.1 Uncharacterized conserved protein YecT, DUF1311 family [Monaibacterium marinum]